MVSLSWDFSTLTGTIRTTHFNDNFADLNAKFGSIYGTDIHARAGIVASQLRDRYSSPPLEVCICPFQSDATWEAGTQQFTFPAAMTRLKRRRVKVPTGYQAYLASIEVYVLDTNGSVGGLSPQVQVFKNGTLVPGATFILETDNSFVVLERSTTPFSSPLLSFTNNDTIEYYIGASNGASATTAARGVYAYEQWKMILIP